MKLLWLLILPMFLFSQNRYISTDLFTAGSDTITSTTSQDTVDWRGWASGSGVGAWIPITDYITGAEKAAGTTLKYALSGETDWTWLEFLQIQIRGTGTKNTATSKTFPVGGLNGAVTLFITPDTTVGAFTLYTGSKIGGN